jgi:hypothetical protein
MMLEPNTALQNNQSLEDPSPDEITAELAADHTRELRQLPDPAFVS